MNNIEAWPLCWPVGRRRAPNGTRTRAKFHAKSRSDEGWVQRNGITLASARDTLFHELELLKATRVVLSTNLKLRLDGLPMSGQRQPDDPGAAVYFHKGGTANNRQLCFACDRWDRVEDNIVAIAKTIEAIRGIDRWGTGDMVQAAFTGFQALPAPPVVTATQAWWDVLGLPADSPKQTVEDRYTELARKYHPDRGGDPAKMAEVNAAIEDFRKGL
jgi:glycine/D-amino acid oxidase-like deaminating enzyme